MGVTLLLTLMLMAAYFLMLYGVVGLLQEKRFFSSAPREVLAALPERKPERFPGAHALGWAAEAVAVAMFLSAAVLAVWDGVQRGYGFGDFFLRFCIMLYGMEVYDILFFDWVLLCRSGFYPHFYPEVKGIVGPGLFGFNKRAHLMHLAVYLPVCGVLAWVGAML